MLPHYACQSGAGFGQNRRGSPESSHHLRRFCIGLEPPGDLVFFWIIEETASSWSQENLALYRLAVASSDLSADFAAARAVDGLFVTRWSPVSTEQNPWISVDLGEVHALSHVVLLWGEFYPTSCWVDLGGVVPFFFCFFVG